MFSLRVALCAVVLLVVAQAARVPRDDKYTTKYDNINLDEILKSDRLLNNYVNCILEKGKCTPDGLELRTRIPDALTNDCAKCSEAQKEGADKVLRFLLKNKAATWAEMEKKYDPTGTYKRKYNDRLTAIKAA